MIPISVSGPEKVPKYDEEGQLQTGDASGSLRGHFESVRAMLLFPTRTTLVRIQHADARELVRTKCRGKKALSISRS